MQTLLDKVGIIDYKYEKLREQNTFNIFSILRNKSDEVNLHSRFIAELLDPKGSHKLGNTFLNHFLSLCDGKTQNFENAQVYREYKDIDLLIRCGSSAIIIENKIWAGDQDKQLERYRNILIAEGATEINIIYLTLDGREPSDNSLGNLKQDLLLEKYLYLFSYENEIVQWLDMCLKEVALLPALRETLVQYKKLINELTGNSMSQDERFEIIDLLRKNDNILQASKIVQNWNHARWHTEWDFWNELENAIKEEFAVLPIQKYNSDNLNSVIHQSRNRNPWYGIMFKVGQFGSDKICIFIERGWGNMYYGVIVLNENNERETIDNVKYKALSEKVEAVSGDSNKHWLGYCHFQERIDFQNFGDENTLRLINSEYRKVFITKMMVEIKDYIKACGLEDYKQPIIISEN